MDVKSSSSRSNRRRKPRKALLKNPGIQNVSGPLLLYRAMETRAKSSIGTPRVSIATAAIIAVATFARLATANLMTIADNVTACFDQPWTIICRQSELNLLPHQIHERNPKATTSKTAEQTESARNHEPTHSRSFPSRAIVVVELNSFSESSSD